MVFLLWMLREACAMEKERQAKTEIIVKKTLFPGKSKQVLTEFLPEKGIVIVPCCFLRHHPGGL